MTQARNVAALRFAHTLRLYEEQGPFTGTPGEILTQFLGDLIEWCDANKIDLQAELSAAVEMLAESAIE